MSLSSSSSVVFALRSSVDNVTLSDSVALSDTVTLSDIMSSINVVLLESDMHETT